jgi:hypothetical protein
MQCLTVAKNEVSMIALPLLWGLSRYARWSVALAFIAHGSAQPRPAHEAAAAKALAVELLELCARQQRLFWSLTRDLAHVDLTPLLRAQGLVSDTGLAEARLILKDYAAILRTRKDLLQMSLKEMDALLHSCGHDVEPAGKAGVVFGMHRLASMTVFEDLNSAQSQVLKALTKVLTWLEGLAQQAGRLAAGRLLELNARQRHAMKSMLEDVLHAQDRTHALVIKVADVQRDTLRQSAPLRTT